MAFIGTKTGLLGLLFVFIGGVYCTTNCGDLNFGEHYIEPVSEENPCPDDEYSTCCLDKIAFVTCDSDAKPGNLTDTTSISDLKAAGKITTFKNVIITRGEPTDIIFPAGCNKNIVVRTEELITVEIIDGSTEHADEKYMDNLSKLNNKFGVVLGYDDDYVIMAPDWFEAFDTDGALPDTQLGLKCTFTKKPHKVPFNENEPCRWRMELKLSYTGILKAALVPAFVGQMN